MKLALRAFAMVVSLLIAMTAGVASYPPLLFWGLSAIGKSDLCTSAEARAGLALMYRTDDVGEDIQKHSKLVARDGKLELYDTPRGKYWIPAGTAHVLGKLLAQQQMEFYGGTERGVQRGQIAFDCGAHVGVFVAEALKRGASKVVAIEPAPANLECLRRNFAKEIAQGQVIVAPVGVWDKDDELPFYEFDNNSAADSFIIKGKTGRVVQKIALTTIDKIFESNKLERLDFLKMDIKGATLNALRGGAHTIDRFHPRISISTEEAEDNPRPIRDYLAGLAKPYRAACGVCTYWNKRKSVDPDVMFFE